MNIKADRLSELRRGMRASAALTPAQQDHIEVRMLTAYMTLSFMWDNVGPARYLLGLDTSTWIYRVASMGHATSLLGWIFVAGVVLATPHAIALLIYPELLWIRWPRKAAATGAVLVAIAWAYLTVLAIPIDGPPLVSNFFGNVVQCFFLSLLYAVSLNSQLAREFRRRFGDDQ